MYRLLQQESNLSLMELKALRLLFSRGGIPMMLRDVLWKQKTGKRKRMGTRQLPSNQENWRREKSVTDLPPDDPRFVPSGKLSTVSPGKRYYIDEKEEPLWKERFPLEELYKRRRLDPREFASLYQQTPYVQGGNLIKVLGGKVTIIQLKSICLL